VISREPGSPQPGSYLAFLVRIQTVDPSAFEMPDAPANKAGAFFMSEGDLQSFKSAFGGKAKTCLFEAGMSANDPQRT
jgi:hypothetical protein